MTFISMTTLLLLAKVMLEIIILETEIEGLVTLTDIYRTGSYMKSAIRLCPQISFCTQSDCLSGLGLAPAWGGGGKEMSLIYYKKKIWEKNTRVKQHATQP